MKITKILGPSPTKMGPQGLILAKVSLRKMITFPEGFSMSRWAKKGRQSGETNSRKCSRITMH
jgi:hypothetical protein